MTWLIACERSGRIRDAMLARGIDAVSCDIEPTRRPGPHIIGDAMEQIERRWAGVVAHPVCKYLTNAGAKHLYIDMKKENGPCPNRFDAMRKGAAFFNAFKRANAPRIAIENPIPHCHARALIGAPMQYVQPWWFGDPFFKATGWWLYNLPKLEPTNKLTPPKPGTDEHKCWSAVHREPPGPDREEKRSQTFPGMAAAIAEQWGLLDGVVGYNDTTLTRESPQTDTGAFTMPFTLTLSADTMDELAAQLAEASAQFNGDDDGGSDETESKPKATRKSRAKPAAEKKPEPAEAPKAETKPEPEKAPEVTLTLADVRDKLAALIAMGEAGSKASVEIIAGLGAKNEQGLPKADALKPEQFAECVALVEAKIEELTPKGVL